MGKCSKSEESVLEVEPVWESVLQVDKYETVQQNLLLVEKVC